MRVNERQLVRAAERAAAELDALAARSPRPSATLRGLVRARRAVGRGLLALVREHWDLGVFDVVFGCIKAFAIYPAVFFAGFAWTIPLLELALLNTQLWTAGYLVLRRRITSAWGRLRFGRSLAQLDRVTAKDVKRVASSYLTQSNLSLVLLPAGGKRGGAKR